VTCLSNTIECFLPKYRHDYLILASLWLLMFSASSQLMILAPILPQVGKQLHIDAALQGTLVTAYAVMLSVFAIVMGPISDRIGRRRILMIGTGAMAVALSLHNLAFDYVSFLIVRALAGAAGGMLSGASVAFVGDYFPYERRGWANGIVATGISAGQILGVPFGTVLAEWYGIYGPFTLFGVTMGGAFLLVWLFVPQPDVELHEEKLSIQAALANYRYLLTHRATAVTATVYGLMFFSFSVYIVYLPTWLTSTFGINGHQVASLFFVGGVASVITGPMAGRVSDRIGRRLIILISCIGLAVVMASTTVALAQFWIAYGLFILMMVSVAMRLSPLQALISEIVPGRQRGSFMSLTIALGQIGMGLGGAAAGWIYTDWGYAGNTMIGAVFILSMGVIVWKMIPEPAPRHASVVDMPRKEKIAS
jgi:predicted MFS family arabinose efflux permease